MMSRFMIEAITVFIVYLVGVLMKFIGNANWFKSKYPQKSLFKHLKPLLINSFSFRTSLSNDDFYKSI